MSITIDERADGIMRQSGLAALYEFFGDKLVVEVLLKSDGFWYVSAHLGDPDGQKVQLLTSRGALKSWRNVVDAVRFIKRTVPDFNNIEINMGILVFTSLSDTRLQSEKDKFRPDEFPK